jgi:hypothetical protein
MPNPVKGEVPLKLSDGREFVLVLDMEAMLSIESIMGKPLPKVLEMAGAGFLSATAAVAQAAFSRHHPEVSRAEVLEMIRTDSAALTEAIALAVEKGFPDATEGKKGATPRRAPRGKPSGRSGAKRA